MVSASSASRPAKLPSIVKVSARIRRAVEEIAMDRVVAVAGRDIVLERTDDALGRSFDADLKGNAVVRSPQIADDHVVAVARTDGVVKGAGLVIGAATCGVTVATRPSLRSI